tara:strand:+ start:951 stop:1220 length:270 start_codon:yes stop_codon:yes gene_type:complete
MNQHTFTGWDNTNRKQGYKKKPIVVKNKKFYEDVERIMEKRDLSKKKAIEVVEGWRIKNIQNNYYAGRKSKRKPNKIQPYSGKKRPRPV